MLLEICDAVEEGQAYMLDSSKLVLDKRYIFTNVSTGEVSLVYLPVFGRETAVELCNFSGRSSLEHSLIPEKTAAT